MSSGTDQQGRSRLGAFEQRTDQWGRRRCPLWRVKTADGRTGGPYTPSILQKGVIEGRLHPGWRASSSRHTVSVRRAIRGAIEAVVAGTPGVESGPGPRWLVWDENGDRWGPYGPAWLLWYVIEGRLKPGWPASDGVQACTVFEALTRRAHWTDYVIPPRQGRCPACGAPTAGAGAACLYCGTDIRVLPMVTGPQPEPSPQFAFIACPSHGCRGAVAVPVDPATRPVWCIDCGASYECLVGRVRFVDGQVVWQQDFWEKSSRPTGSKDWQVRYDGINTDERMALLEFRGPADMAIAADDHFACLLEPKTRRILGFGNATLGRNWRFPRSSTSCLVPTTLLLAGVVAAVLAKML